MNESNYPGWYVEAEYEDSLTRSQMRRDNYPDGMLTGEAIIVGTTLAICAVLFLLLLTGVFA